MQESRILAGVGYRKRSAGGDHLTGEALAKGDDEAVLFPTRQADADAAAQNLVCLVQEEQADKRGAGNGGCLIHNTLKDLIEVRAGGNGPSGLHQRV
jgi:hypothetical protein